jgi:hypothetical protein
MSVNGWYKLVSTSYTGLVTFADNDEDVIALKDTAIDVNGMDSKHYVSFKFEVTNLTSRDATLSMRPYSFIDAVFENFDAYNAANGNVTAGSALETALNDAASANTAKHAYAISSVYCRYYDPETEEYVTVGDTTIQNSIWRYSSGEDTWQDAGGQPQQITFADIFKDIPLKGKENTTSYPAQLYFSFVNNESNQALAEYKDWLLGHDDDPSLPSYGRNRCALMLGSTWDALTNKQPVLNYLTDFYARELASIMEDSEISSFRLNVKYFEFIGSYGKT